MNTEFTFLRKIRMGQREVTYTYIVQYCSNYISYRQIKNAMPNSRCLKKDNYLKLFNRSVPYTNSTLTVFVKSI